MTTKRAFIELLIKPGRRAVIELGTIQAIFTSEGFDCLSIASPDDPITILMTGGQQVETYGISVASIMIAMQTYGRIDGWLPLP